MHIYSEHFIQNKYFNWYCSIIESAKNRIIENLYIEEHHIIPKSLGGTNKKHNLVKLTYREHFLCHWLLTKFVSGTKHRKKMMHALLFMIGDNKLGVKNFTSWQYEIAKKTAKESMIGENNTFYGKKHSEETKEKMSIGQKRHNELFGRPAHSEETIEKLRNSRLGKKHTEAQQQSRKKYFENNNIHWYNNGKESLMIVEGNPIPEGFIKGRGKTFKIEVKIEYYNNGIVNKRFKTNHPIPEGFVKGFLNIKKKSWYNNGFTNMMISEDDIAPDGFIKGKIQSQQKKI